MNATLENILPHCACILKIYESTYHRCFFNQTIKFSKHPVATARAWHSLSSGGGEKRERALSIHSVFPFLVNFFCRIFFPNFSPF